MTDTGNDYVYKKAIILGNGFDVAYGFKTKYSDFIGSEYFKELLATDNRLAKHIEDKFTKAKWVDIEVEIGFYSAMLERNTLIEDFDAETSRFKNEYESLTRSLYLYIDSIRSGKTNPKMENLVSHWLNLLLGKE